MGEVARVALLGGHRHDLASVSKRNTLTSWRDRGAPDVSVGARETRSGLGKVRSHADLEPARPSFMRVKRVDPPCLFVNHHSGTGRGARDRKAVVVRAS